MLKLTGTLVNVFKPAQKPDSEPSKPKAQIMGDIALKDGEIRKDLLTVSVSPETYADLQSKVGSEVSIPVGAFAPAKGSVLFFGI